MNTALDKNIPPPPNVMRNLSVIACRDCEKRHVLHLQATDEGQVTDDVIVQARWVDGMVQLSSQAWLCTPCAAKAKISTAAEEVREGHERIRVVEGRTWGRR